MNRQVLLRRRPVGAPAASDFAVVDAPLPIARDGEVLRRTISLSLDPSVAPISTAVGDGPAA